MSSIVLAITGASGSPYAMRLLEVLLRAGKEVQLVISDAGKTVLRHEMAPHVAQDCFRWEDLLAWRGQSVSRQSDQVHYHECRDFTAPIASGSFLTDGMVICPCSGSTLAAVAHGGGSNLIHRAAEVHLKERRRLILVTREAPLSFAHIENMRLAHLAGATILPASPGFYHHPVDIADLVDFVIARICDQLGVPHELVRRWGGCS